MIALSLAGCSIDDSVSIEKPVDTYEVQNDTVMPVVEKKQLEPSKEIPIEKRTIKLPESVINEAVEQCKGKPMWGVNLALVEVNYVKGAVIDAVIVLHNGNDLERLVTLSYQPIYKPKLAASTGIYYDPAPIEAYGWVTIDKLKMRMQENETLVVPVHLMVPTEYPKELPEKWEFDIRASGVAIKEMQYEIKVTTVENDTVLECHIPYQLLENELSAIKTIISTESSEVPQAVDYNSVNGILKIINLKEKTVRNLTIVYEYGDPVVIDYVQRWLITMASG